MPTARLQVFYDGACPLCRREIEWLRQRDVRHRVSFVDIAASDFREADYGKTYDELMGQLHGREPDGTWVTGVEVFRRLYEAAGFRRLAALSRWPGVRHGLGWGYRVFARYRTRLTGRCNESCRVDARSDAADQDMAASPDPLARESA